jgi:hypothetical protein
MVGFEVADRKKPKAAAKPPGDDEITTFKTKVRIARTLEQIAAHRGILKQDVLDDYADRFEEDLLRLMALRQEELRRKPQ